MPSDRRTRGQGGRAIGSGSDVERTLRDTSHAAVLEGGAAGEANEQSGDQPVMLMPPMIDQAEVSGASSLRARSRRADVPAGASSEAEGEENEVQQISPRSSLRAENADEQHMMCDDCLFAHGPGGICLGRSKDNQTALGLLTSREYVRFDDHDDSNTGWAVVEDDVLGSYDLRMRVGLDNVRLAMTEFSGGKFDCDNPPVCHRLLLS